MVKKTILNVYKNIFTILPKGIVMFELKRKTAYISHFCRFVCFPRTITQIYDVMLTNLDSIKVYLASIYTKCLFLF